MAADPDAEFWYSYCMICGIGRTDRTTFAEHAAKEHK